MIQAILGNKIKNYFDQKAFDREDSLTASFFGLMFYLDSELVEKYFYSLLEVEPGQVQDVEFWPNWSAKNTSNKRSVEPDVFVRFENMDLIIEVKKEGVDLGIEQINNQLQAYQNEYRDEEKSLFYIGITQNKEDLLGKISNSSNIKRHNAKIKIYNWSDLAFTFHKTVFDQSFNQNQIISDIKSLLSLHHVVYQLPDFGKIGQKNIDLNQAKSFAILKKVFSRQAFAYTLPQWSKLSKYELSEYKL